MTNYKNLVNNMPILYMQEEVLADKNGIPVELIYRNVNAHFEKNFFRKEEVVGKKASEIFPESMPDFLAIMIMLISLEGFKEISVVSEPMSFTSSSVTILMTVCPGVRLPNTSSPTARS